MARILVGVAGSIAAYRSPDLVRALKAQGHDLRLVLTDGGAKFVTPKTLETFAGVRVGSNDVWSDDHMGTDHIEGARWAEMILVYGATANFMAKLAGGFCDDFLSLQILATTAPVVLCPAMNVEMWQNAATQANVQTLRARGLRLVGPIAGNLACGETGLGHVAHHEEILNFVTESFAPDDKKIFADKNILLSFGSMRTPIDEVRFLQNSSSGRMGLELAKAFAASGARVHALAGLLDTDVEQELAQSNFASLARYRGIADYGLLLGQAFEACDFFISAAAVLDFAVKPAAGKIERTERASLHLEVQPTPDYVAWASARKKPSQKIVAFALESGSWAEAMERALAKKRRKGADAIIVNRSGLADAGPFARTNELRIAWGFAGEETTAAIGGEGAKLAKTESARLLVQFLGQNF